ncbi:hypothetical protein [uncultured Clostridium sp.]|nr:hypothetical protein [uncultured Clostridium sp.]
MAIEEEHNRISIYTLTYKYIFGKIDWNIRSKIDTIIVKGDSFRYD